MSTDKMSSLYKRILKGASVMSGGTLLSRLLGFIRDVIFARFFGTAAGADAFMVAFRLPNMLRDLIGEGAANSSFIPVMSEYKNQKPQELTAFLQATFSWAVIVLTAVTIVGILIAPLIVRLIAPGFLAETGKMTLTIVLTQIMFPYLIFIGLTAFLSAIQLVFGSFMMPAIGPCILNIVLIISTLMAVVWMKEPIYGLAIGVLVGGILQCWFQWIGVKRYGFSLTWAKNLFHPGALQVGRLILPRLLGSAVYQMNLFVDMICASFVTIVGAGGVSALYYATRIEQLPIGVFGVALVSATLPSLSAQVSAGDQKAFVKTLKFSLRNIFVVMLPISVILFFFSEPIIRIIFQRGAFDAHSTAMASSALRFSALGLMGYGGVKILVSAFHALQDTKTPVKVAIVSLVVNAVLNVILMFPLKIAGIALSSAIASYISLILLWFLLQKKLIAQSTKMDKNNDA